MGHSMYQFLCERCWHEESAEHEDTAKPEHACPGCGAEGAWLGPFAMPRFESRKDSWPLLTSPLYVSAGRVDRRVNPR
jgi:hypothetical protein